jgi:ribonuclease E
MREPREGGEFPREALAEPAQDAAEGEDAGIEHGAEGGVERHSGNGEPREDGQRRRRRGRRGGRRNRRGREGGDQPYAAQGNGHHDDGHHDNIQHENGHPAFDAEVAEAAADLGGPPPSQVPVAHESAGHEARGYDEPRHEPRHEPRPEPVAHAEVPAEPPAPAEPPKRRSTVRERAPVIGALSETAPPPAEPSAPTPEPEPVAAAPAEPEAAQAEAKPRRFGWWNRRG